LTRAKCICFIFRPQPHPIITAFSQYIRYRRNQGADFALNIYAPIISECQFQKYIHLTGPGITNPPLKPTDPLSAKMKIKNLTFIALISMIICGIGILRFLEVRNQSVILRYSHQHQIPEPNSDRPVSISRSMILLLLAVGLIGALGVRRKNKNKKIPARPNTSQITSEDRDKAFIRLNKQYLNLQYKITQHKFSGDSPPDCLLKELSDLERKVRLISRALE